MRRHGDSIVGYWEKRIDVAMGAEFESASMRHSVSPVISERVLDGSAPRWRLFSPQKQLRIDGAAILIEFTGRPFRCAILVTPHAHRVGTPGTPLRVGNELHIINSARVCLDYLVRRCRFFSARAQCHMSPSLTFPDISHCLLANAVHLRQF